MVRLVMSVLAVLSLLVGAASGAFQEAVSQIRIQKMTKAQFLNMRSLGLDVVESQNGEFVVLAKSGDLQQLNQLQIQYTVEHPDLAAYYESRNVAAAPFGGFRTLAQIGGFLDSLSTLYPTICSPKFSVGNTYEGRPMWVMRISNNPTVEQGKPSVFYNALIHAREPAGANTLLNFMQYLATNYGVDPTVTDVVNNRELYFMPVVNPDGYYYNESTNPGGGGMWRKNRRPLSGGYFGIDLNRNFSFMWGYDEYGASNIMNSEVYRGSAPFSEPETQHVRDFIIAHNFAIVHNIHTYSNLFLWPYGYDRVWSNKEEFYKNLGDSMTQVNHYAPEVGWTLYPTNGDADDWGWGDILTKPRTISVTTEMGSSTDGFWPTVSRIPVIAAENVQAELFLAKIAANPYVIGPPVEPTISVADSSTPNYAVHWHDTDTVNPPVSYRLTEYSGKHTVVDDAESDHGYWNRSMFSLSSVRKHAGSYSWFSQAANAANEWLTAKTPYLVKTNDSLVFWIWYDTEQDWDYVYAQVSLDGGRMFTSLPGNLTTNVNPNGMNTGNGITGASTTWKRAAHDLSPYVGKQIIIRLAYFTDSYTLGEGVYLDDIGPVDMFTSQTQVASGITDTLYSFSSKPAGQYWYRVSGTDAQGQESNLSPLVSTHVYQQFVVGDVTGDGVVDISDLGFLVDYLFNNGPAPDPTARGDVDCSGNVDVADLTLMVDYLFLNTPAPHCP
jgi:hypothetical protein